MEQETTGTQGSSQGGGLVPDVLGQVGAGAIPGVLPVQRGSEGVSDRPTPQSVFGDVKGGSGKCARCGKYVANVSFHESRCADKKSEGGRASDRPTPETARFRVGICPVTGQQYRVPRTEDEWEALASRLERERDEAREALFAEKERLCADLATKDARLVQLRAEVERLRGLLSQVRFVAYQPEAVREALAGKEGAPSQRLDLGDKIIHQRDIARLWATELANALDGMGYPDRIQMDAFRQVEQSWKEGV